MMKEKKTLDDLIAAKKDDLAKLEEKKAALDRRIRACKADIEKYTMMKNHEQLNAISNALDNRGVSIEDVLAAIASGDLLTLQEKMEQNSNVENGGLDGQESEEEGF